jgi:lathosterol oxidase
MESHSLFTLPFAINLARYLIMAGIPFLAFYVLFPEKVAKLKIQSRLARRGDFIREFLHSVKNMAIFVAVGLLILKTPLSEFTLYYRDIHAYPWWWIPVSVLLSLVIHDTYFYWLHRSIHHPRLFKTFHLLHHKSVNPSPLASYSFNFLEGVLEALVLVPILVLVPLHPLGLLIFTTLALGINVYGHLGYELAPRWLRRTFLFELLNTSVHHNLHHSRFKGNYGLYFRFWDRLMGTEHPLYVQEYDRVQARRFGKKEPIDPSHTSKTTLVLLFLTITLCSLQAQSGIEGRWIDAQEGGVIAIYEEEGRYYGRLDSVFDAADRAKVEGKRIMVFSDFEWQKDQSYCCGTIRMPRYGITVKGRMNLREEDVLEVSGSYGFISRSRTLRRLP